MNNINFMFLVDNVKYGGFAVYTAHLYESFKRVGYNPRIFKIRKTSSAKPKQFTHNLTCYSIDVEHAENLARNEPTIIVCTYWKQYAAEIVRLLRAGASIILHDPTEYASGLFDAIKACGTRTVCIRQRNVENLREFGVKSKFIMHPYIRARVPTKRGYVKWNAVSYSRVDFDKHTEIIVEANKLLPPESRVAIFGELNRIYAFHKLDKDTPEWRNEYHGTFPMDPWAAVGLARQANFVVDMSAIKGDGDGSQYTFLEAWDAGTPLLLNAKWINRGDGEMQRGENCEAVEDGRQLAAMLEWEPSELAFARLPKGGEQSLLQHAPDVIIPQYVAALGLPSVVRSD
jgi:hypothetical protein